ncbi:hypothetical protein N7539_008024 [Penicillium diatomitis]|uniref:Uncharacterized protein n=1 Tax=Penicillium diatomitis TaxID=2819901 RepID=A0A9X0BN42_9EURO|nr:uncharacterized protein N7539_008024 [Penicillium diatomitis]KAJ5474958.1 hypothetical protein N7539_008024 [Penicillium diatomitis]
MTAIVNAAIVGDSQCRGCHEGEPGNKLLIKQMQEGFENVTLISVGRQNFSLHLKHETRQAQRASSTLATSALHEYDHKDGRLNAGGMVAMA